MLWVYGNYTFFNSFSAGIDLDIQNQTSVKSIPALKLLIDYNYFQIPLQALTVYSAHAITTQTKHDIIIYKYHQEFITDILSTIKYHLYMSTNERTTCICTYRPKL